MYDLSILIPARNEMFLSRTVEDILSKIEGNTEIIVFLDGQWADPGIEQHERVTVIYSPHSIGQRAGTNEACKLSKAKYVMKLDAHCLMGQGFDRIMMEDMQDDWTMVPVMKNLHAFDWVCPDGHRRDQSPSGPCRECGKPTEMEIVWEARKSPNSTSFCFDKTLHFQYFNEFAKRPEAQTDLSETMSIQGSCFMLTRQKYWELNICDDTEFGSWGQQGVEVSCKTWFSGGKVVCTKKTSYAHLFRTQGGDFGFPYPNPEDAINRAREKSRELFLKGTWKGMVPGRDMNWLLKKFAPVPDWDITKGVIYYTDNELDPKIMSAVQKQILRTIPSNRIVSSSLKPIDFGKNVLVRGERGYLSMFKQILSALEKSTCDVIFFCEHDVLYHPSHFEFTPPKKDVFYYNENVWKIDPYKGKALHYPCRQTSGLVAYRKVLIEHYKERVRRVEAEGFSMKMGFEPGTHNRPERIDDRKSEAYFSPFPNVDIRHGKNLTKTRWNKEEFRNPKYTEGWTESDEVPGWGKSIDILLHYDAIDR